MTRCLALAVAIIAATLSPGPAPAGAASKQSPQMAQATVPNIPPPPVIRRLPPVPQPLANRPERTAPRPAANAGPVEPNMVIVSLPSDAGVPAAEVAAAHGLALIAEARIQLIDRRILRLRIPDGRSVAEVIEALSGDTRLHAAQPSFLYELQAGGSPSAPQFAAEKLGLSEAHRLTRGKGVVVALIDTGVDTEHAALRGARIRSLSVLGSVTPRPGEHGTQMAGILTAQNILVGVAPAAEMVAIEAFAQTGATPPRSHSLAVAQALDRAAQAGAQIVNLSFAGGQDAMLSSVIDALALRGVIMIGAAGNNGANAPPSWPAAHPAVIAVTATDANDALFPGANRGTYVAVAAPGVDIITPSLGGRYAIISGTSSAAAHVSGAAALIIEQHPEIGPETLRTLLFNTAVDLGAPGPDVEYGAGLISLVNALSLPPERLAQPTE